MGSFSNIFNGYKRAPEDQNPWEDFFNQPCGYTLNEVKKMSKNNKEIIVENHECVCVADMPSEKEIYTNQTALSYYREIANSFMSVRKEIIDEVKILWQKLFNNSKNVLGILIRGTDYTSGQPYGHSIPPTPEDCIKDVEKMDAANKYDYIFIATEDSQIRTQFIGKFKEKLKYLLPKKEVEYDYSRGSFLSMYKDVYGNMDFHKTYLLSMVIVAKCIDIISARTSGACGAFIISEGFRNQLVYFLGEY